MEGLGPAIWLLVQTHTSRTCLASKQMWPFKVQFNCSRYDYCIGCCSPQFVCFSACYCLLILSLLFFSLARWLLRAFSFTSFWFQWNTFWRTEKARLGILFSVLYLRYVHFLVYCYVRYIQALLREGGRNILLISRHFAMS